MTLTKRTQRAQRFLRTLRVLKKERLLSLRNIKALWIQSEDGWKIPAFTGTEEEADAFWAALQDPGPAWPMLDEDCLHDGFAEGILESWREDE